MQQSGVQLLLLLESLPGLCTTLQCQQRLQILEQQRPYQAQAELSGVVLLSISDPCMATIQQPGCI